MGLFNGTTYPDPREELRARALRGSEIGESHVAIPVSLILESLSVKECKAKTVVNGDRQKGLLIEVKCERVVDPATGKHPGMHVNGRTNW